MRLGVDGGGARRRRVACHMVIRGCDEWPPGFLGALGVLGVADWPWVPPSLTTRHTLTHRLPSLPRPRPHSPEAPVNSHTGPAGVG